MMRPVYALLGGLLALASTATAQTASILPVPHPEAGAASSAAPAAGPAASTIYFAADEMPAFPGGAAAMLQFLSRKLQYPSEALDRQLSGKVHVTFVVDPEGHLHDPRVVRGLSAGLDDEALRLIRIMPWWTPGRVQGRPVWVRVTLPIVFRAL